MKDYSLGMYEKTLPDNMELCEKMDLAKECGFDHIELCIDLNEERAARLNWSAAQRKEIKAYSEKIGLPITTLSLSLLRKTPLGLLDDEKNREALRVFEAGCELAVDMGSRVMLINGYDVYGEESTPETRERFFVNYEKCARIASRRGVLCGIENAEMPFCKTIGDAVRLSDFVQSPYMKVYGDIANLNVAVDYDTDRAVEDILGNKGKVIAMHLKDSINGEYRYTGLGDGRVDFERCIKAAKEIGVRIFTAEMFCVESSDQIERLRTISAFFRHYLDI